jgi:predicted dehydrogenase
VIDVAYLSVHFDDSTLAHFHCNWLAPVKVRTIIIGGSKRLVLYDDTEASEKVKIYDRGIDGCKSGDLYRTLVQYRLGDMYAPNLDTREALSRCCEHFAECINTGREPITGGIEGLTIVRILAAAERSIVEDSRKVPL